MDGLVADKFTRLENKVRNVAKKVLEKDSNFTGQLELEIHFRDGIIQRVYEIRLRRKV